MWHFVAACFGPVTPSFEGIAMTSTRTDTSPPRRARWRWLGGTALAGLALAVGLYAGGGPAQKVAVTPDLAWVPPDAALLVQIRAAELWDTDPVKALRQAFEERPGRFEVDLVEVLGVPVTEVEKVSLVFRSLGGLLGRGPLGPGRLGEVVPPLGKVEGGGGDKKPLPPPALEKKPSLPDVEKRPPDKGATRGPRRPDVFGRPVLFASLQPPPGVGVEGSRGGPDLMIITVTNAKALATVRKQVKERGQEEQVGGKTFYRNKTRDDDAVYFVNERTFVRGGVKAIREGIARGGKAETAGPLVPALKRAMAKHHLVVGLQVKGEAADELRGLLDVRGEGERRALAPLAAVQGGVLWADAGKETTATVELSFPDETRAGRGLHAAQDGLALLRIRVLGSLLAQSEDRLDHVSGQEEERVALGLLALERLESALREVKAERQGSVVRLSARASTDLAALEKQSKTLAKARQGDEEAKRARLRRLSGNNLKEILLAAHSFADVYKYLPPAAICDKKTGKPLLSWRVVLLPYLEQNPLYKQFKLDQPWDSEHNKKLLESMPKIYAPVGVKTKEPHLTFYREFVAAPKSFQHTAWRMDPQPNSPFGAVGTRFPAGIPDGTSNTIGVVEAGEPVPWTKPEPLIHPEKGALPKLGGHFKDGFMVGMMDGSIRFISSRALTDPAAVQDLRHMITAADGMVISDRIEKYTRPVR
jgi:hypothetical protein